MNNIKTSINSITLLVFSIFLQSFSFLSIKYATLNEGFYTVALVAIAFLFIASRAIVWQILLKYVELSIVYPYASLVQVLILSYSVILFGETITIYNLLGLAMMLSGIYYMSKENSNA